MSYFQKEEQTDSLYTKNAEGFQLEEGRRRIPIPRTKSMAGLKNSHTHRCVSTFCIFLITLYFLFFFNRKFFLKSYTK